MGKILGKALLCAVMGGLVWLICEPFFPSQFNDPNWSSVERTFVFFLLLVIGATVGFWNGWQRGGRTNIILGTLLGSVFGTIGGQIGSAIGGSLLEVLFGGSAIFGRGDWAVDVMLARFVTFLPIGLFLGAGAGSSLRSFRGVLSGAVGGAIAAGLAGLLFDVIGMLASGPLTAGAAAGEMREVGAAGRAFLAFSLGFFIGLFTGIVELATRQAWVRLVLGRNEGKEWPIDSAETTIGRDERAHIPLFADPRLPQLAAVIQRHGHEYVLADPGSPIGVGLNGQRIPGQAVLSPGDTIQVGELQLQFLMRSGAARRAQEGRAKGIPVGGAPAQPAQPIQPIQPQPATTMSNPTVAAPAGMGMGALSLVVTSGPSAGERFPLNGDMEVGREGSGIRLSWDAQASRRHAVIRVAGGSLQVTDLGSTNGTLVNGQRVQNSALKPGDTLQIGSTQFRVEQG